jgi:hypothetical protein
MRADLSLCLRSGFRVLKETGHGPLVDERLVGVAVHERDFLGNVPELLPQLAANRALQVLPKPGLARGGQGYRGRAALTAGHPGDLAPQDRVQRPPLRRA